MEKMTSRKHYELLLSLDAVKAYPETCEWIEHQIQLLNRKNTASKKPSATQIANVILADTLFAEMEEGVQYTVTNMIKSIECCAALSNQKVSAIANAMAEAGKLKKETIKGRSYFTRGWN